MAMPKRGMSKDAVLSALESFRAGDMSWRDGRCWAYVYDPGPEASEVIERAYLSFLSDNALDFSAFPSVLRLENEVVAIAAAHLGGDESVVGSFTSGGTESILLAVKTARDYHREKRPEIREPEMVLPVTAHAAFHKAGHYLGVEPVLVPVDPRTFRADVDEVRRAITKDTILVVGSAVSYAHGVVDPIPALGELALEHGLWLHVDGCMGGFLLPYFRRLGAVIPDFDFRVPGVTSISMDLHKYAFAAKGASTILYRTPELRRHQIYVCAQWTGYTVVNPTVQSTKSAGPLAAAWAALHFIGDEGYLELARRMRDATQRVRAGIEAIPGLRILGNPDMNLVAFTSDELNVFHVIDEMKRRGWYIQPQLGFHGSKENVHLSIQPSNARWADAFLADLSEATLAARALSAAAGDDSLRDALAALGSGPIAPEQLAGLLRLAGADGSGLPERMAGINALLNSLPPERTEQILVEYVNQLFRQRSES